MSKIVPKKPVKKKKYKDGRISFQAKIWIGFAIFFIVASFGMSAFSISKVGATFLNSDIWFYIHRSLITVVFIFLAFYKRKESVPLYASIFLLEYVIMLWIGTFLFPIRVNVLLSYIWAIAAFVASVIAYAKRQDKRTGRICRFDFAIFYVFLSNLIFLLYIKHINNNAFLLTSAIIGGVALITAIILVILFKEKIDEKQNRIWIPLCALLLVAVFAYFTLTTANFCLDYSKPIIQNVEIVDKKIITGTRQPTTFDVYVMINGKKVGISVPSNVYHNSEQGDFINISTYKGLLKQPYYFYDNLVVE